MDEGLEQTYFKRRITMGMEAGNHIAMYVPMQQSCMFFTCTPEPKVQ